ncbi:MAG: 1-(5-phosphoribosyl)-5-amino-4-imidazole-carboxylate carboxylase, partial [Lachnospiraceae bacterium]|nr:1-(5-phosphoribosyl)-5-amino-4-imidazole-carboxylate carboxylase [Lachnospiraceae bacterium]
MNQREELKEVLARVAEGSVSVEEAYDKLKQEPFVDLGFANIDLDRMRRKGASEVIYGAGKSAEQIADIVSAMKDAGQENVLITRVDAPKAEAVHILLEHKGLGWKYYGDGEIGVVGGCKEADGKGKIAVVTAG